MIEALGELIVEGTLLIREDTKHPSDKFRFREFVLEANSEVDGEAKMVILKLKLVQERCDLLDDLRAGYRLKVTFIIDGRKWVNPATNQTQYFNSLEAINIELLDDSHNFETDIRPPEPKVQDEPIPPLPEVNTGLPF